MKRTPSCLRTIPVILASIFCLTALPQAPGAAERTLSGSLVVLDTTAGEDECFIPAVPQTFCFEAESFTTDWEYVYNVWLRFPANWTVTDVRVLGTPACDGGAPGATSPGPSRPRPTR